MKSYSYLFAILFVFLLNGCITSKYSVENFDSTIPLENINGTYLAHDEKLIRFFRPKRQNWYRMKDFCDLFTITFNGKDTLRVEYHTEEGIKETVYRGKLKNGYFQFYYSKIIIPFPPVFMRIEKERFRVGNDVDKNMLVNYIDGGFGEFLIFMGGYTEEHTTTFYTIEQEPDDVFIPFCREGKWGFKSSNGTIFIEPMYDFVRAFDSKALARVKIDGKWGMIRKDGYYFLPPIYDKIGTYNDDMWAYPVEKEKKIGYINEYKKTIVPLIFEKDTVHRRFSDYDYERKENKMVIQLNNKYGFISSKGILAPPVLDKIKSGSFGGLMLENRYSSYCKVRYKGESWYLSRDGYLYPYKVKVIFSVLDKNNRINVWDTPWEFQPIEVEPDDYFIPFYQDGKWGYKNTGGEILIKPLYDNIRPFDAQGLAQVCYEGKWKNIRKNHRQVNSVEYDYIYPYDELMKGYRIEKDGLTGFIDEYGKVFVPVCFQMDITTLYGMHQQSGAYKQLSVIKDGKYGFIDSTGILCPPVLDKILMGQFQELQGYKGTYCQVLYKGKEYCLSNDGYLFPSKISLFTAFLDEENVILAKKLLKINMEE